METIKIRLVWQYPLSAFTVSVSDGTLASPTAYTDCDTAEIRITDANRKPGAHPTVVRIHAAELSFSFLLRDVRADYPIFVPSCHAAVLPETDNRSYADIASATEKRRLKSKTEIMEAEPEYSFEQADKDTRECPCPAWLGVPGDMRMFEASMRSRASGHNKNIMDYVTPCTYGGHNLKKVYPEEWQDCMAAEELSCRPSVRFSFLSGRGVGCTDTVRRSLENDWMPILHSTHTDNGILYHTQFFVTQEISPLKDGCIRGSDCFVSHIQGSWHKTNETIRARVRDITEAEFLREEETVMYIRICAKNGGEVPNYAFFLSPNPLKDWDWAYPMPQLSYDGENGFLTSDKTGRVLMIASLNGAPMPLREMTVMTMPGETTEVIYRIPFRPIDKARAFALQKQSYEERLSEARAFWQTAVDGAAHLTLPEKRVEDMIHAGICHCMIGYHGKNPNEPINPIVGIYPGIGTESSPGVQFFDAIGLTKTAERAIRFFFAFQEENGAVGSYRGYDSETGSILRMLGEHYRMTRDADFVKTLETPILRACDCIAHWMQQNEKEAYKNGNGYGMLNGSTSDNDEAFHAWLLNSISYAGLEAAAMLLNAVGNDRAAEIAALADTLKENILTSLTASFTRGPVLPASDGTWFRSCAPWPDLDAPFFLNTDGHFGNDEECLNRDMENLAFLVLHHVISPESAFADEILKFYTEYMTDNNAGLNQPYYCEHAVLHAKRGEVKPFLREFYSIPASLADRETYSFWETYGAWVPNKLHEETWFLMRCRTMLCLEDTDTDTLRLLSLVPRAWYEDGKEIRIDGLRCYYGILSLRVVSHINDGFIHAECALQADGFPVPAAVGIRLPHPSDNVPAVRTTKGTYQPETETVTLDGRELLRKAVLDVFFSAPQNA